MKLTGTNLRIARGGRIVVDGLSLSVVAGQALVLSGPNGSGKTTLLRTIAGLIGPEAGQVALEGGDRELSVGEQCHLIAHKDAVKSALSVQENARFWACYLGGNDTAVETALSQLGLDALADVPAGYLSAGQRRRLGLARLLLAARPVWLLDEPTVSLDAASVAALSDIVRGHLSSGGLVVAATHVPLGFGDAVVELRLGADAGAA